MIDVDQYRTSHPAFQPAAQEASWLTESRHTALEQLGEKGLPTRRDEDWKYSSPRRLSQIAFSYDDQDHTVAVRAMLEELRVPESAAELVFVNGRFSTALSNIDTLPDGVIVRPLSDPLSHQVAQAHLGRVASAQQTSEGFTALNSAFLQDGLVVLVPKRAVVERPIVAVYVATSSAGPIVCHPRNLVVLAQEAQGSIVEHYVALDSAQTWTNALTEVVLDAGARLTHTLWQQGGVGTHHIGRLAVHQARDSQFVSQTLWLGGEWVRQDIQVDLSQPGADCTLNGLYLVGDSDHLDNHTRIDHRAPHCQSRELYKGVLGGRATGVFNGKVVVHAHAASTDADQANHNLLVSPKATINTKPELEIYHNNVKCAHGTTVGQLDEAAVGYLRSRGISEVHARQILTRAFSAEMVQAVRDPVLQRRVGDAVDAKLGRLQPASQGE